MSVTDEQWRNLADGLAHLSDLLEPMGMKVVLHNHVGTYVETAAETKRFLDETDPAKVGWCLDVGHLWLYGYDSSAAIERYKEAIRVIHLHGVEKGVDHKEISTLSDSQVRSVLAAAEGGMSDRVVTLEVFGETELHRSLETLRRLMV